MGIDLLVPRDIQRLRSGPSRHLFHSCSESPDFPRIAMVGKVVYGIALAMMPGLMYLTLGSGRVDESAPTHHLAAFDLWKSAEPSFQKEVPMHF